jgi:hypothetical protein
MSADYWPYTASEVAKIRDLLPAGSEKVVARIIEGARQYAWMADGRAKHKPNPKRELEKLSDAISELRRALQLSESAESHLRSRYRQSRAYDSPMHVVDLWDAVIRFQVENAEGFKEAPSATAGAIGRKFERSLEKHFRNAFDLARGNKSSRGWPSFLTACVQPLQERHEMPGIAVKSWQDKNRKNSARKMPN